MSEFAMLGEIDVYNAPQWEAEIRDWLSSGGRPVIEMSRVTFIDSTGLNMLARVSESHDQRLILRGVKPTIARLLDLTELDGLFTIIP